MRGHSISGRWPRSTGIPRTYAAAVSLDPVRHPIAVINRNLVLGSPNQITGRWIIFASCFAGTWYQSLNAEQKP